MSNYGVIATRARRILVSVPPEIDSEVPRFIQKAQRDAEHAYDFAAMRSNLVLQTSIGSRFAKIIGSTTLDSDAEFLHPTSDLPFGSETSLPIADSGLFQLQLSIPAATPAIASISKFSFPNEGFAQHGFKKGMFITLQGFVTGFTLATTGWELLDVDVVAPNQVTAQRVGGAGGVTHLDFGSGDERIFTAAFKTGINKFPIGWIDDKDELRSLYGGNPTNQRPRHLELRISSLHEPEFSVYPNADKVYTIEVPGIFRLWKDELNVPPDATTNWFTQHAQEYLTYHAAAAVFWEQRDVENASLWGARAEKELKNLIAAEKGRRPFRTELPIRKGPRGGKVSRSPRF